MAPILGIIASQNYVRLLPGSYDSIATINPNGASATFSSIPQTYKHLQIRGITLGSAGPANPTLRMNGDTGSSYSWHQLVGSGSGTPGSGGSGTQTFMYCGYWAGTTNAPEGLVIDILDYTNTNKNKTIRVLEGSDVNGAGGYVGFWSGSWQSTSAVNSLTFTFNYAANSQLALYGIKG